MNTTLQEGIALLEGIQSGRDEIASSVQLIVAPPYTHLSKTVELASGASNLTIAAQDCAADEGGAYTGEVSAGMISDIGVSHVILGHSERRKYYAETDEIIKQKVEIALKYKLTPIFCCGETLQERNESMHFEIVADQLKKALFLLDESNFGKIIVAYEPVWAIGTGETATPEQAQEMHKHIRSVISEKYGKHIAEQTSILYGGSCNASNAQSLFSQLDVDGGLVGGASLTASEFIDVAKALGE